MQNSEQKIVTTESNEICQTPVGSPRSESKTSSFLGTPESLQSKVLTPEIIKKDLPKIYLEIMKFQKGDLLYGLEGSRIEIRKLLESELKTKLITADKYNDLFIGSHTNILRKESDPEVVLQQFKSNYSEEEIRRATSYAQFLREHGLSETLLDLNMGFFEFESFKKKSCKKAILFTKAEGHKIHFILDLINMHEVLPGSRVNSRYKESYTASELRFLYRLYLIHPSYVDHVIFYHKGEIVRPPWESDPGPVFYRNYYHPSLKNVKKLKSFFSSMSVMNVEDTPTSSQMTGAKRPISDSSDLDEPSKKKSSSESF